MFKEICQKKYILYFEEIRDIVFVGFFNLILSYIILLLFQII